MSNYFPIPSPPPELVQQWLGEQYGVPTAPGEATSHVATKAAQWGADQELEACVAWIDDTDCEDPQEVSLRLRWHRRPKPPSLKEQALEALREAESSGCIYVNGRSDTIRRALEALPND